MLDISKEDISIDYEVSTDLSIDYIEQIIDEKKKKKN